MSSPTPAASNRRRTVAAVLVGIAAIVYGISPIDIIPDLLAPFGLVDDAGVFVAAGLGIWRLLAGRRK